MVSRPQALGVTLSQAVQGVRQCPPHHHKAGSEAGQHCPGTTREGESVGSPTETILSQPCCVFSKTSNSASDGVCAAQGPQAPMV